MYKVIFGLGNPGDRFVGTRHNAGFALLDTIASRLAMGGWMYDASLNAAVAVVPDGSTVLVKPYTFMNMTGVCASKVLRRFGATPAELVVAHDDMAFDVGRARISDSGSAHGHNGLGSLILHLGTENFLRVRIGIGRRAEGVSLLEHVLGRFSESDEGNMYPILLEAADVLIQLACGVARIDGSDSRLTVADAKSRLKSYTGAPA